MRAVIDIYTQSATMLRYLQDHADELGVDDSITMGGGGSMTLREAMKILEDKLGNSEEGGLPA
jgi:hypothetical protein